MTGRTGGKRRDARLNSDALYRIQMIMTDDAWLYDVVALSVWMLQAVVGGVYMAP